MPTGHYSVTMIRLLHGFFLLLMQVHERIASQNENFLLAGANCSESHVVMKLYAKQLVSDIIYVES